MFLRYSVRLTHRTTVVATRRCYRISQQHQSSPSPSTRSMSSSVKTHSSLSITSTERQRVSPPKPFDFDDYLQTRPPRLAHTARPSCALRSSSPQAVSATIETLRNWSKAASRRRPAKHCKTCKRSSRPAGVSLGRSSRRRYAPSAGPPRRRTY